MRDRSKPMIFAVVFAGVLLIVLGGLAGLLAIVFRTAGELW